MFGRVLTTVAAMGLVTTIGCAEDPGDGCPDCADGTATAAELRDNLFGNLQTVMDSDAVLFGQQRFNITGVKSDGQQWIADVDSLDRSDVRDVTGQHPGLVGIDVWDLAIKSDDLSPSPAVHAAAARHVYEQGGVVTMEWEMRGCNSSDDASTGFQGAGNEDCLCKIANDDSFARQWLIDGKLARFADALDRYDMTSMPLIFRPLHELNADWFWWGSRYWDCGSRIPGATVTGADAYRKVFRTIVDYLRQERGLDNLLVAYAPDKLQGAGSSEDALYLVGYPGDEYVDVLGIDLYYDAERSLDEQTRTYQRYLEMVTRLARTRGKLAALTETGNYRMSQEATAEDTRWFTEHLLSLMLGNPAVRLAYIATWENRSDEYYAPYPGHVAADNLRAFHDSGDTLFLGDFDLYRAPR
jgi:mannan endo-1,4-beta-mannosidase